MSLPAAPGTVSYVTDPLMPVHVQKQRALLQQQIQRDPAEAGRRCVRFAMGLGIAIGIALAGLTAPLLALVGAGWVAAVLGVAGWATVAVGTPFCIGWREEGRNQAAHRDLRAIDAQWQIATPPGASDLVHQIAADVRGLPQHMRADFAPLLTVVRECCSALVAAPSEEKYLSMIRDRATAVSQVRGEYEAVEARQRAEDAADRFAADPTGHDLVLANQMRDALAAIRGGHANSSTDLAVGPAGATEAS
jgi:hypothetical protein